MKDMLEQMFKGNPNHVEVGGSQEVLDVTFMKKGGSEKSPVVSIYLGDKYAKWYGEFPQTASTIPDLKPLADYLHEHGFKQNLE